MEDMDVLIPKLLSVTAAGAFPLFQWYWSTAQEGVIFPKPLSPCTGYQQSFGSTDHSEDSNFHPCQIPLLVFLKQSYKSAQYSCLPLPYNSAAEK